MTVPAILAAAEIEFATHGFATARTESIAARANVVKGLIFHYFKCKEGLYEAVLARAYQPLLEAFHHSFDGNCCATEALLSSVERLLAAMTEHPLSPILFMLESIQGGGEHLRKLGLPSLYQQVEILLRNGIASGEFREMDPEYGAINIIGLCGFFFCAANNISHFSGKNDNVLSPQSLARHTAEVMAFVARGTRNGS